jgi:hypothetical protein
MDDDNITDGIHGVCLSQRVEHIYFRYGENGALFNGKSGIIWTGGRIDGSEGLINPFIYFFIPESRWWIRDG